MNKQLTWLYTHCRAIGITEQSDSKKWEHDIALFTIRQKEIIEEFLRVTRPMVEDWTSCPECGEAWDDHKKDCKLKNVVNNAKILLNQL